ncbi:TetR/AcrR family transcriptional regulator [Rhizohabitans arisaemae]|uniref:TetR/AcrR family transcriptional regulator n=1 Tax=Rhizohabitans arisaemae TaxID=2720610 RepID=UPI0024B26C9A|nr:TetR/AcrR family transcriptional regulator [Rhizohabitans arisaemae]
MVTRDQIISSAIRHLNADPTASMAEIGEAAGVSRATLHRHFPSRDALMEVLGQRALDGWERALDLAGIESATESEDPERIVATMRTLIDLIVRDAEEHEFVLTEHLMLRFPDFVARSAELENREVDFYRAAQRCGVLRSDLPARWIAGVVYGLLVAACACLRRGDIGRREIDRLLLETFLHGSIAK